MHKYRGLSIMTSAVVWSFLLWGVVQIKPTLAPPPPTVDGPIIVVTPDFPRPIPQIDPKEKEVKKPQPIDVAQNDPVSIAQPADTIIDAEPETTGAGPTIDGTTVINIGSHEEPLTASGEVIVVANRDCNERPLAANPLQPFNVDRAYPIRLEERGITGLVHATLEIDETGKPTNVKIDSSSNSGFDSAVIREGMKMKFRPARKDCEFAAGTWALNVKFEILDQ
jgi:TonB family protein